MQAERKAKLACAFPKQRTDIMKNRFIAYFRRGRWLRMALSYLTHPRRLRELLSSASQLLHRSGREKLRDDAMLLLHYATDVVTGRYKNYNTRAMLLVIAALLYLVAPLDMLPDILIGGFIDDTAVVLYIIHTIGNELQRYRPHHDADRLHH